MADPTYYTVYELATGDALRAAYTELPFDAGTEARRTDLAPTAKVRDPGASGNMNRWNGSIWIEVAQPAASTSPEQQTVDLEFTTSAIGVILKAPDDSTWRLEVDNLGNLSTTEVT